MDSARAQLPPDFKLEYISDLLARQGDFVTRQKYLDSLMVRAFMLPERAVLEGQFGTKAEAEAHSNLSLTAMEAMHDFLTEEFYTQVLKPYLALRYTPEAADSITLTAGPVNPEHMLWKRRLVEHALRRNPDLMDVDALLDEVGLPKSEEVVDIQPANSDTPDDNGLT